MLYYQVCSDLAPYYLTRLVHFAYSPPIGKVKAFDEEYTLNKDFQELVLQVADGLELDETEAAKLTILAEEDETILGRSKKECAVIRFHQQRNYLLNCMLLLLELSKEEEQLLDEDIGDSLGYLGQYVNENILRASVPAAGAANSLSRPRFVPACMATMHEIRGWLQRLTEQVTSAAVLGRASEVQFQETIELTYISLIQQHELLSVILCHAIEKHVAVEQDFIDFLRVLKMSTRYDSCTSESYLHPSSYLCILFGWGCSKLLWQYMLVANLISSSHAHTWHLYHIIRLDRGERDHRTGQKTEYSHLPTVR